jgi:hypothetical protein
MLQVRIFFSKSNQLLYAFKMGHKIKAIRERLNSINATAKDFHLKLSHEEIPIWNKKMDELILLHVQKKLLVERMIRRKL